MGGRNFWGEGGNKKYSRWIHRFLSLPYLILILPYPYPTPYHPTQSHPCLILFLTLPHFTLILPHPTQSHPCPILFLALPYFTLILPLPHPTLSLPSSTNLSGKRITRQLELSKLTGHHDDGTEGAGKGTHTP